MGYFDKIKGVDSAKSKRTGNYPRGDGRYFARIDKCSIETNKNGVDVAICAVTVIHKVDPDSPHSTGESLSPLCVLATNQQYFLPEIFSLITAVVGFDMDGADRDGRVEAMNTAFGADNPLEGLVVEFFTTEKVKKKSSGKDPDKLTADDMITTSTFVRSVPASELAETLSAKELQTYFPGDTLEKLIEAEQAAA